MKQKSENSSSILCLLQALATKLEALEDTIKFHTPKDLLTSKEAAKYLNIKMNWLNKLCSLDRITYTQPGGKARFFKKSDLDSYLKQNIRKSDNDLDREADDNLFINPKRK
ncbi:MAG TPA: helix-turn-helix domain-containing protein [Edaphocola sp.]|nr:helix-turn-helix domain-containing protein [Edaphocola sp.]